VESSERVTRVGRRDVKKPKHVVVIGGGASGVLVAARVLDATGAHPARVTLLERGRIVGAGVAYGTDDSEHLLNVRASGMSADPSRPHEFADWASGVGMRDPTQFAPRLRYRAYLANHLEAAACGAPDGGLDILHDEAVRLEPSESRCSIELRTGRRLDADAAVVATGNPPPGVPAALQPVAHDESWIGDPWAPGAIERLARARSILLIGTGLTAIDVLLSASRTSQAEIVAVSRHGLLPAAHLADARPGKVDVTELVADANSLRDLTRRVCAFARDPENDVDWRDVVDGFRPLLNAHWTRLSAIERKNFVTRLARFWDVHRHRMPPASASKVAQLEATGRLSTLAATVVSVEARAATISVELRVAGRTVRVESDAVVNCTGPGRGWQQSSRTLIGDLVQRGHAIPDPLGLGLASTPNGQLVDASGGTIPNVFVLGPPRRGTLWETTAVPEIRSQALHIADHVVIGAPSESTSRTESDSSIPS